LNQFNRPIARAVHAARIHAPLKPVGRFARKPQPPGSGANGHRIKKGGFEHDIVRAFIHFGLFSAHDAADRGGSLGIGDHQIVWIEIVNGSVNRRDFFARAGTAR
jgi:hypothetical protein